MDTIQLSWVLMAGEIIAVMFSLLLLTKITKANPETKLSDGITEQAKEPKIIELEERISSLQDEIAKSRLSYNKIQNELNDSKKRGLDASEELLRYKKQYGLENMEVQRLKKEESELKTKIVSKAQEKEQELEKMRAQSLTLEGELKEKNAELEFLKKENKELSLKSKDLYEQAKKVKKEKEVFDNVSAVDEKKDKESPAPLQEKVVKKESPPEVGRGGKKQKIGEVLLAHNLISKDVLDKAVEYQAKIGGNVTQYLLAYGHIDEGDLAQCLCTQFSIPYLPLSSYKVPEEIIKLVPVDLAEKYWLIPIDRVDNFLTVVMADPLDLKAIKEVEEVTGCKVQPFVGVLSEIMEALKGYYNVVIEEDEKQTKRRIPFFIDTNTYQGIERRNSLRFKAQIGISYPVENQYKESKTTDVSRTGFLFESDSPLPVGSLVTLQVDLPKDYSHLPIAVIVQVVRVEPLKNNKYAVGVKMIKISKEELSAILEYASKYGKT